MRHIPLCMCLCVATIWSAHLVTAMDDDKRAPSGFTGVRGKKPNDDPPYNTDTIETVPSENSGNNEINNDDRTQYVSKRVPSGFFGMRGKKPFDGWIGPQDDEDVYKRVPTGFFGLRGKKEMDYGMDYDKRVPSGFFGLRGKKQYDYLNLDEDESNYFDKRVPSGFFGLRGKRDYDEDEFEDIKRAAAENRFFGMRGKKQPSRTGFFGMRGKKYPYEFRGKFVGVRGKKSVNEFGAPEYVNSDEVPRYGTDLDLNQLMLLLNEKNSDQLRM